MKPYHISQRFQNGEIKGLERAATAFLAYRSMLILGAHELRNGRAPDIIIDPPVTDQEVQRAAYRSLPDWAKEALEGKWTM